MSVWNIQGLCKYVDSIDMKKYIEQFDICGFVETWADKDYDFTHFLSNYSVFSSMRERRNRRGRNSGGVSVFVKAEFADNYSVKQICGDLENCVVLHIDCRDELVTDKNIIACFVYISPERSPIYDDPTSNGVVMFEEQLDTINTLYPNNHVLIAGDFNSRTGNLDDFIRDDNVDHIFSSDVDYDADTFSMERKAKDTVVNNFGVALIDLCKTHNVHMLNGRLSDEGNVTCLANNGSSTVDYILTSTAMFDFIRNFTVGNRDESDHFPLSCTFTLPGRNVTNRDNNIDMQHNDVTQQTRIRWDETLADDFYIRFRELLGHNIVHIYEQMQISIDVALSIIVDVYVRSAEKMQKPSITGINRHKSTQPSWWDRDCRDAKRKKNQALQHFRFYGSRENLEEYKYLKNPFRTLCKKKEEDEQPNKKQQLISARKNSKTFWKLIKTQRTTTSGPDDSVTSNDWFNHFKQLLCTNDASSSTLLEENNNIDDIFSMPITAEEVHHSLNKLKINKSGGPDGLVAEMMKLSTNDITPVLVDLFNTIFTTGTFPKDWGRSIICPLHKKGSKTNPNNYRGISLMDVLNKCFTNILNSRLTLWTEENSILDEAQAGFRAGYSTTDNIFNLQAMVQKYLSKKGGRFYCLFVDFSKAFDTIDHHKLLNSLVQRGVGGKLLHILRSMYENLCSCVKTKQGLTDYFTCNIGTRQGCVLSPVLFTLFIDDLIKTLRNRAPHGIFISQEIQDIYALMYADDVASVADTVGGIQSQLNIISDFCETSGMKVNLDKTKIIVFRNGGFIRRNECWYYRNQVVNVVSKYDYMGLLFTPKLSWSQSQGLLATKAKKAVIQLCSLSKAFGTLCISDYFKLFDTMVAPILCYGSEIWGYTFAEKIEQVQNQFCRRILHLPVHTSTIFLLGECGRYPMSIVYYIRCIKYWLKLTKMSVNRYPHQCYKLLKHLDDNGRTTWASEVKKLLYRFGFGFVWLSQEVGDEKAFLLEFKIRIIDCAAQDWYARLRDSSKAAHYHMYKSLLNTELYLTIDMPTKFRRSLSVFRCSVHNLAIETGRHTNTPKECRLCVLCNMHTIEDEYHFLLVCPVYCNLRAKYLDPKYCQLPSLMKFYAIMSCQDTSVLQCLSQYVYHAFRHRKGLLNS